MSTVQVDLPEDLLRAASVNADAQSPASTSREVAKLLALELYREGSVSLGQAAELCGVSQAEFMKFAAEREVALHYTLCDLEQDRKFIERLPS
jgi:predicted HTH domain antitoxin